MIDLIDECAVDLRQYGYRTRTHKKYGIVEGRVEIDEGQKTGFGKGEYYILNSPFIHNLDDKCKEQTALLLEKNLSLMLKHCKLNESSRYLLVGIGNPEILADSLGKKVIDRIEINSFDENNKLFKISPNIFANTGIATSEIVTILGFALDIDCIILIDSLATNNLSRLGISFQLNSAGITPGSALNCQSKKIDKDSLGVPCISLGVPFMIFSKDLVPKSQEELILAPKDIHQNVDTCADIIAMAINGALKVEKNL